MKQSLKNLVQNDASTKFYIWMHRGIGLVYLVAFGPLLFELKGLIGSTGLLPAENLLKLSQEQHGVVGSFFHFPSIFHLWPSDTMLLVLTISGLIGGLLLLFRRTAFFGALLAWGCFLSITSIGGDFFIIIIDLFLAEVGFLALFSTYYATNRNSIPWLVHLVFVMLNFRLWFCMGINKFYMPYEMWVDFTFFDTFFQAQPMPTPVAYYLHQTPSSLKHLAQICLFIGEVILPFAVFGNRRWRLVGFATFVSISVLIQLSGNYGYFNVLSIVVALPLLQTYPVSTNSGSISKIVKTVLGLQFILQTIYCITIFNPKPFSPQNQFNFLFSNLQVDSQFGKTLVKPFQILERWRICNPYGVFKGIPQYHGEIRFYGSDEEGIWQPYEFKFLPSGNTDELQFFAPYYPRLDHLMFYETLSESNYKYNPLNKIYDQKHAWTCRFLKALFENDENIARLLKKNPFVNSGPNQIKTQVFRLQFDISTKGNWEELYMVGYERVYLSDSCSAPLITYDQALSTISDHWADQYLSE